ncbi:MAG: hypothetical protein AB7I79_13340 [Rhizobiaceae bacterium]
MSPAIVGALVGLVVGVADFWFLRVLAGRVDLAETKSVLTITGVIQLIALPVMGWFVGPALFGE